MLQDYSKDLIIREEVVKKASLLYFSVIVWKLPYLIEAYSLGLDSAGPFGVRVAYSSFHLFWSGVDLVGVRTDARTARSAQGPR